MNSKLSLVIITKNEADQIEAAIDSARFADEVIVVDDDSSDQTRVLAEAKGAKVITRKMAGDYAAQRNYGLERASHDWVFFLDADERCTDALAAEITSVIGRSEYGAYYCKRQDVFLGKVLHHGETNSVTLLRLARKASGKWIRPVHETWQVSGQIGLLGNPLMHYPHLSISAFVDKINHYTSLEAEYRRQQGQSFNLFDLLIYPPAKFVYNYIILQGFRDGFPGLVMAYLMSLHSFSVRVKLYEPTV